MKKRIRTAGEKKIDKSKESLRFVNVCAKKNILELKEIHSNQIFSRSNKRLSSLSQHDF
jgi:hypothetical protein